MTENDQPLEGEVLPAKVSAQEHVHVFHSLVDGATSLTMFCVCGEVLAL